MSRSKIHSAKYLHKHHEPVLLATAKEELVTCLRCLYWLRRYIPVGPLLKKHQAWQQMHYRSGVERRNWT